jgi:hypothetical protein
MTARSGSAMEAPCLMAARRSRRQPARDYRPRVNTDPRSKVSPAKVGKAMRLAFSLRQAPRVDWSMFGLPMVVLGDGARGLR